jgi:hypothetical protein
MESYFLTFHMFVMAMMLDGNEIAAKQDSNRQFHSN